MCICLFIVHTFFGLFTALNGFNIQRRDVESGIRHLKSELKNEIGNENLDALDSLGDDVLRELQNEQESQKKR